MGRWGQKPAAPPKGDVVDTYVLSPTDLEELYRKYGKPGEIAPGVKAERGRDSHRRQQATPAPEVEVASPPPDIMGEIEATFEEETDVAHEGADETTDEVGDDSHDGE